MTIPFTLPDLLDNSGGERTMTNALNTLLHRTTRFSGARKIRGKLNVPRERFWERGKEEYMWAGKW